jgi:DnaK suppressor protein
VKAAAVGGGLERSISMRPRSAAQRRREKYRSLLLNAKRDLLASLGVKVRTLSEAAPASEEDLAQISHEEFVSLRLNGLDYEKLRMVEEALDRLAAGDYGVCLACGSPIPDKRLRVVPWARFCVACQEQAGSQSDDAELLEPVSSGPS